MSDAGTIGFRTRGWTEGDGEADGRETWEGLAVERLVNGAFAP